ncbi:MAG: PD-(D/E)XK nuclease family protein [Gemmataceae bacterium]
MTARISLLCGPLRSGKTETLLVQACARVRQEPGSVLWLAPSAGAIRCLRKRLLNKGGCLGLRLATLGELVYSSLEGSLMRPLSLAQRHLILEECLTRLHRDGSLRYFETVLHSPGFVEQMRAAFDAMTEESGAPMPPAQGSGQTRELGRIFEAYRQGLRQAAHPDFASCHQDTLARIRQKVGPDLEAVRVVIVDGFSEYTPAETALLEALVEVVEEVHIALRYEASDPRTELFLFARQTFDFWEKREPHKPRLPMVARQEPTGLHHLSEQLFRPLRHIKPGNCADGVSVIQGAGVTGEVRLVARRVKQMLQSGLSPDAIDLVVRQPGNYSDLLRSTFRDYGLPLALDESIPLAWLPSIGLLLQGLRVPDEEFAFRRLTAVLRHTQFRPSWGNPALARKAEALLRLLGVPHGREAYLQAVQRWAEQPQPGLEDETAEESRRLRTHHLAAECQAYLRHFLNLWQEAPGLAPLENHVAWLSWFAQEIGLLQDEAGHEAWELLRTELDIWLARERKQHPGLMDRRTFVQRLTSLARRAYRQVIAPLAGHVAVLTPEQARHRTTQVRFVLGMGEKSYPAPPQESFLQGLISPDHARIEAAEHEAREKALFHDVLVQATEQLVLCYPAVDERGQELLAGSYLQMALTCFAEHAVPVEARSMPLDRYFLEVPQGATEYRVQVGASWPAAAGSLSSRQREQLDAMASLARARFHEKHFTRFDGLIQEADLVRRVADQFSARKVISPTALEDYITCPFRFFLRHVLRLQPLEDPREEVEVTRRGMAFHRALARLHRQLRERGTHAPSEQVGEEFLHQLQLVIEEDVNRTSGLAGKELWRLEGQRCLRDGRRYRSQWTKFLEPWTQLGIQPQPSHFEVDFGLPGSDSSGNLPLVLCHEGIEVRLGGRIDRVDVAEWNDEMVFWVIDYKTGRASNYVSSELAAFHKLQLTLYALAVAEVLYQGRKARPLGLFYWMVSDGGPKLALPPRNKAAWLEQREIWEAVRQQLISWVATIARRIRQGQFPLAPRTEDCTRTCAYGPICRISQARTTGKTWDLPLPSMEAPPA